MLEFDGFLVVFTEPFVVAALVLEGCVLLLALSLLSVFVPACPEVVSALLCPLVISVSLVVELAVSPGLPGLPQPDRQRDNALKMAAIRKMGFLCFMINFPSGSQALSLQAACNRIFHYGVLEARINNDNGNGGYNHCSKHFRPIRCIALLQNNLS